MTAGPAIYIQSAADRKDELQDAFDTMMGAIGGQAPDTYHVGVHDPADDDYVEREVDTLADARTTISDMVAERDLPYDVPDDLEELVVEERDWR